MCRLAQKLAQVSFLYLGENVVFPQVRSPLATLGHRTLDKTGYFCYIPTPYLTPNSRNMAYLRHFIGFATLLVTLGNLSSANLNNNALLVGGGFREAPQNKSALNKAKSSPKLLENYFAEKLDDLDIQLHPGTEHRPDSKPTTITSRRCKSIVYRTLEKLPPAHQNQLSDLTLFYTKDGRRGFGGSGSIILRCLNVEDNELVAVLTHEIGHLVDGNLLFGTDTKDVSGFYDFEIPVTIDDPSLNFYRISWTSEKTRKQDTTYLDFVSQYATSDPFEDFAETYAYYRLHGLEFRKLMELNDALQQKYSFMKKYVFDEKEFDIGDDESKLDLWTRNYDVTVLPFPLKDFFTS